jgi:hypothetical protein
MGKIAEHEISTRRFCRYFVHAPLCILKPFHGLEPTSILVDGPGEDIEFENTFHKYKEQRILYQPEVAPPSYLLRSKISAQGLLRSFNLNSFVSRSSGVQTNPAGRPSFSLLTFTP